MAAMVWMWLKYILQCFLHWSLILSVMMLGCGGASWKVTSHWGQYSWKGINVDIVGPWLVPVSGLHTVYRGKNDTCLAMGYIFVSHTHPNNDAIQYIMIQSRVLSLEAKQMEPPGCGLSASRTSVNKSISFIKYSNSDILLEHLKIAPYFTF